MDATRIALKKLHAIVIDDTTRSKTKATTNPAYVLTFNAILMNLGFILSEEAFSTLSNYNKEKIAAISDEVINVLATLKGSHVTHRPMYPNFPQQVIEASYLELYLNALMHYYTCNNTPKPQNFVALLLIRSLLIKPNTRRFCN